MKESKYRQEFIEILIQEMSEGASLKELPAIFGVCLSTIKNWRKEHSDFNNAIIIGIELSEAWWYIQGRKNIENKEFNSTLFYMNMKNRFGWADSQKTEHAFKGLEELAKKLPNFFPEE